MALTTPGIKLPTGISTAADVKALQKSLGVKADGVYGPITKAAHEKSLAEQSAKQPTSNYQDLTGLILSGAPSSDPSQQVQYYKDAMAMAQAAQNSATASTLAQYDATRPILAQNYANANTAAQNTARLSAIGNNEYLAAKGMAGNLYSGAQSGMSETSRIAGDVSMQNAMNTNQQDYTAQLATVESQIAQAQASGNQQLAQIASQYYEMIAQAQANAQANASSNYWNAVSAAQNQYDAKVQQDFAAQQYADSKAKTTSSSKKSSTSAYDKFIASGKTAKSAVSTYGAR